MPRNRTDLTDEQQRAIVEDAQRRIDKGESVAVAGAAAGAPHGVSEATVRRWAKTQDRPLTRPLADQTAATVAFAVYSAERQRNLVQRLLNVAARVVAKLEKQKEPDAALLERTTRVVANLSVADRQLLSALGPRNPKQGDQDEPPTHAQGDEQGKPEASAAPAATFREQWQQDVARFKSEST